MKKKELAVAGIVVAFLLLVGMVWFGHSQGAFNLGASCAQPGDLFVITPQGPFSCTMADDKAVLHTFEIRNLASTYNRGSGQALYCGAGNTLAGDVYIDNQNAGHFSGVVPTGGNPGAGPISLQTSTIAVQFYLGSYPFGNGWTGGAANCQNPVESSGIWWDSSTLTEIGATTTTTLAHSGNGGTTQTTIADASSVLNQAPGNATEANSNVYLLAIGLIVLIAIALGVAYLAGWLK